MKSDFTIVEMNNFTLDLEITEDGNRVVITPELFSKINDTPIFHRWLSTMNLKIERKQQ